LAVAQERAGLPAEAGVAFEKRARAESDSPMNVNSLLIRYLADNGKAQEAVAMAEGFLKRRHDLFTRQAYAIALAKAGKPEQAMEQIRKAMEPGYLDVRLYFDAGMIARQRNDTEAAARYFRKAFELGSGGFYSGEILKQLGSLSNSSEN
jgi:Flp pilus assembly protein TadD